MSVAVAVELETITCCNCGMVFGVPPVLVREWRRTGQGFKCPSGHPLTFGEGESDQLRKQLAQKEQQLDQQKAATREAREERDREARRVVAQKAVVTRLKNKAAKGECPCCGRLFPDLAGHMATEHPDFEASPEAGAAEPPA